MYALLLLLVPVALAASPNSRIVGGSNVNIANYPWQGSYRTASDSHNCGCVFIGGNYVLTAAHCGGTSDYTMEFGNVNRDEGPFSSVDSVLLNPNYGNGPGFSPNDIAIITAVSIENNPSPGSIPENADNPETRGWITGWGRTCGSCDLPVALQGVNIPIISDATCSQMHGTSFQSDNMICVWDANGQASGACNGDSGGPLSVGNVIYGLTSWGRTGCSTAYPSAYNRVGAFREWICENTGQDAAGC